MATVLTLLASTYPPSLAALCIRSYVLGAGMTLTTLLSMTTIHLQLHPFVSLDVSLVTMVGMVVVMMAPFVPVIKATQVMVLTATVVRATGKEMGVVETRVVMIVATAALAVTAVTATVTVGTDTGPVMTSQQWLPRRPRAMENFHPIASNNSSHVSCPNPEAATTG